MSKLANCGVTIPDSNCAPTRRVASRFALMEWLEACGRACTRWCNKLDELQHADHTETRQEMRRRAQSLLRSNAYLLISGQLLGCYLSVLLIEAGFNLSSSIRVVHRSFLYLDCIFMGIFLATECPLGDPPCAAPRCT